MHLLVVEDEPGIADFLKQGLEEEGYILDVAMDGLHGLELAQTRSYDLLLIDWVLPKVTGIELTKTFRKKNSVTPIIFLTARDTAEETIEGLQSGANDYIKKPFHFEELLERIKVQLRPRSGEQEKLTLGRISLDISTHQTFNNNQEVALTQKEFALLVYLIRNKGNVCNRTSIIKHVWDIHFEYNTGVIDVYINALRKKLELGKDNDHIHTIRGVGYLAKEK